MGLSGRAAGAQPGDWELAVFSVGSIKDDRLDLTHFETVRIEQSARAEQYLLRPDDVVVGARSTVVKAAYVPPTTPSRAVADATLLVLRAREPGLGLYLWWYLTSAIGRQDVASRMVGTSLLHLPAKELADLDVPIPPWTELRRLTELIDASERAYVAGIEAATLRRTLIRDAVIGRLRDAAKPEGENTWR